METPLVNSAVYLLHREVLDQAAPSSITRQFHYISA